MAKLAFIVALALTAVSVAGCGGGGSGGDNGVADKSADQIVADSLAAAKGASSVHIQGSVDSGSQPFSIDMQLAVDKGATGTIELNGKTVEVTVVGDNVYLKADGDFWEKFGGPAVAALVKDRWLVAPVSTPAFAQFTSFTKMDDFFQGVLGDTSSSLEKGDETTVNGTSAIALTDPSKDGTLYVATEGEPFPLKIEGEGGQGAINFTDWNDAFDIETPEDALDVSKLPGLGG